jgi:hypothetical protein
VTDAAFSAEEQRWLKAWDDKLQQFADGTMTVDDVLEWTWKNKVLNAINVTLQRIKRSERPGIDPRRNDNTWVTVAAERGQRKEEMSGLALQALSYVYQRLKDRGHEFDVDWMATANGVVVISINVRNLREFQNRRAEEKGARA